MARAWLATRHHQVVADHAKRIKRLQQRIADIYTFPIAAKLATINPATSLHKALAHQKTQHCPASQGPA